MFRWRCGTFATQAIVTVDLSGAAVPLVYPTSLLNRTIQSNQAVTQTWHRLVSLVSRNT